MIQVHHLQSRIGETIHFKCPHCGKDLTVELKSLEGDPDAVEVYWGKDSKEIEEKRRKVEEEIKE
jgi:transposase-like protein